MIRKQLDAEPQPVRSSLEAPKATDQEEPVAPNVTRRGSRSLHRELSILRKTALRGSFKGQMIA